jgi:hypothetical protein
MPQLVTSPAATRGAVTAPQVSSRAETRSGRHVTTAARATGLALCSMFFLDCLADEGWPENVGRGSSPAKSLHQH